MICSQVHLLSGGPVGTRIFFRFCGGHILTGAVGHNGIQPIKAFSLHVHSLVHWSFVYCSPTFNNLPLGSGHPKKHRCRVYDVQARPPLGTKHTPEFLRILASEISLTNYLSIYSLKFFFYGNYFWSSDVLAHQNFAFITH